MPGTVGRIQGVWHIRNTYHHNADISKLDEGINPNPFLNEGYGRWHHIGTIWSSWSPSQESGTSSKVGKCSWRMTQYIFFKFWRQRSVIHQIVCIFWDKSNGLVKITYGCHPWDQECPPSIRKVPDNPPSRTYLLSDISVLFIICYVFSKTNPTRGSVLVKECHPYPMVQEGSWSSSIRKILHGIFLGTCECDISNCMYFLWQIHRWDCQI